LAPNRCRYTEIIPLLYSQTTLFFSDPSTASSFAYAIPPQRLNSIRSISIDWQIQEVRLPTSDKKWRGIWDLVANTSSIREVRLIVLAQERPNWHEEFQWKWKHDGIAKRIETGELMMDFWNFGTKAGAVFGEDERRNLPNTYQPPRQWGKEWYEP
jgi:hypothetical protein